MIFLNIDECFYTLTEHQPRQFQQQTIAHLLNRQDVLLRAPTGSGKTETAIAPFLFAKPLKRDFPIDAMGSAQPKAIAKQQTKVFGRLILGYQE